MTVEIHFRHLEGLAEKSKESLSRRRTLRVYQHIRGLCFQSFQSPCYEEWCGKEHDPSLNFGQEKALLPILLVQVPTCAKKHIYINKNKMTQQWFNWCSLSTFLIQIGTWVNYRNKLSQQVTLCHTGPRTNPWLKVGHLCCRMSVNENSDWFLPALKAKP